MRYDGRTMTARTVEADLCIVGAGPAGISLAQEFVGAPVAVAVVESGGAAPDRFHQRLNDGIVIGDRYARLRDTRHRQAGGTAHLWNSPGPGGGAGAKYVPLDPSDFTASEGDELADGRSAIRSSSRSIGAHSGCVVWARSNTTPQTGQPTIADRSASMNSSPPRCINSGIERCSRRRSSIESAHATTSLCITTSRSTGLKPSMPRATSAWRARYRDMAGASTSGRAHSCWRPVPSKTPGCCCCRRAAGVTRRGIIRAGWDGV